MSATGTTLQAFELETLPSNIEEFEHLASRELPKFYKQAYRHLGNSHDAEDAVQDALLSAYKNLSQFRGNARLSTWIMSIVTNAARMQRRRARPSISFDQQLGACEDGITLLDTCEHNGPGPEEIFSNAELCSLLDKATEQLSPAARKAIRLYYVEGMTAAEASEVLGIRVGTIKAQLARARVKIANFLRKELGWPVPAR